MPGEGPGRAAGHERGRTTATRTGKTVDRTGTALRVGLLLAALAGPAAAHAEALEAVVESGAGRPVPHAVVFALPLGSDGTPLEPPRPTVVDQIDKEYVPYVTAVRVGTAINFPNHDRIRHHVYSFSPAKTFEIPLYKGTPAEPILFDKPGPVTLGCNIHDWMKAYVFVSETPHYAVTEADGKATLRDLPPGEYAVRVWHPRLKGEVKATSQRVSVGNGADRSLTFAIEQKRVWRPRRAPSLGSGGGYR